jgi:iron complex outermembrane receptor protein
MKYQLIFILFLVCLPFFSITQEAPLVEKNEILIQEVKVKGSREIKKTPDLQQQTDKILSSMVGVTLIKRGNYAQEPTIRGMNAGQINTTIDGMQIFGACTDRMDPISSYVEPNNLSSILLNLGPTENQNGSQIGGSLDFKLMKAQPNADKLFTGRIGLGFETNALARQSLGSLQYSRKRWAILVNGIYRKADNYRAGNNQIIPFSYYEKYNIGASFTGILNENQTLYFDYLQDNGKDIGYPALTMDVAFANAKIGSMSHTITKIGKSINNWETKVYFNYIDHAMDDSKRPPETVPMHMDMPGTSKTMGFYSGGNIRFSKKQYINIKLTGFQNDLHAEMTMYPSNGNKMFMLTIPDARRTVIGLNVSTNIEITKKTDLSIGGRLESVSSQITTLIGRQTMTSFYSGNPDKTNWIYNAFVKINQKVGKNVVVFAGGAIALRNTTLQELYGFYLFNRLDSHDYLGNPDLKTEKSININLGSKLTLSKLSVSGQVFSYFFNNYISGLRLEDYSVMTIGGAGVKRYTNLSNALLYGGELTIDWKMSNGFTFQSINSISVGKDNENDALPFIPPLKSINKIQYDLKGYLMKLEYIIAAAQNRVNTLKYGEKSTPSFQVINLAISKKFNFEKNTLNCSLAMENILDTPYYEHLDVMKINRQGRNLIIHATFSF